MSVPISDLQKARIAEEVAQSALTFAAAYYVSGTAEQQQKVTAALKQAVLTILESDEPTKEACPLPKEPTGA